MKKRGGASSLLVVVIVLMLSAFLAYTSRLSEQKRYEYGTLFAKLYAMPPGAIPGPCSTSLTDDSGLPWLTPSGY